MAAVFISPAVIVPAMADVFTGYVVFAVTVAMFIGSAFKVHALAAVVIGSGIIAVFMGFSALAPAKAAVFNAFNVNVPPMAAVFIGSTVIVPSVAAVFISVVIISSAVAAVFIESAVIVPATAAVFISSAVIVPDVANVFIGSAFIVLATAAVFTGSVVIVPCTTAAFVATSAFLSARLIARGNSIPTLVTTFPFRAVFITLVSTGMVRVIVRTPTALIFGTRQIVNVKHIIVNNMINGSRLTIRQNHPFFVIFRILNISMISATFIPVFATQPGST
jgi:hypothetical protein